MIVDKFLANYVGSIKLAIEDKKEALASGVHTDLYTVGKLQGAVNGLREALQLLENTVEDLDQ